MKARALIGASLVVLLTISGCSDTFLDVIKEKIVQDEAEADSKDITAFYFLDADNAALPADVAATITDTNISATVLFDTDVTALVASFSTTGASVTVGGTTQASRVTTNNFTNPVTYRVTAEDISYQDYTVTVRFSTNIPPTITITQPDGVGDTADTSYSIQWTDSDPDDNATITLYYDTNDSGYDGTLITSDISEDSSTNSYLWDTSSVPNGSYYIYAAIDDGTNPVIYDYSFGPVSVDTTAPTLTSVSITSSNADPALSKVGDTVTVSLTASETLIGQPVVTIAGQAAAEASAGGNSYTATYTMTAGDAEGTLPFTIDFSDAAGTAGTQVTGTTDASSVVFDRTAPTLTAVSIASNNADPTLATVGDTVTVSLTANEA